MLPLSIEEISQAIGGKIHSSDDYKSKKITKISTDTRTIEKGCLFIAIKGDNFDGNNFVSKAYELGAIATICEVITNNTDIIQIIVDDSRQALLDLAEYYLKKFDIPVVALTGSVGKTTTKEMVACVLSQKFNTLKTKGNFNNQIGLPKTVFEIDNTIEAVVLEMGMDHKGQIASLSKVAKPNCAIITNIGVSHLENLGSQEGILNAKMEILSGMSVNSPIILNGDDKFLKNAQISVKRPTYYYGLNNENCDIYAINIVENVQSTSFDVVDKIDNCTFTVTIPTIGIHNVYDALSAVCIGKIYKIDNNKIAQGLASYQPSGMRQKVVNASGIIVIEDCYNASPDSIRASFSALSSIKSNGKKIAVLGDMLELGSVSTEAHKKSGIEAKNAGVDLLLTYGDHSKATTQTALENGLKSIHFDDKKLLFNELLSHIVEGDVILFKGSRAMKLEEIITKLYEKFPKNNI